jgi:hypothetical protein
VTETPTLPSLTAEERSALEAAARELIAEFRESKAQPQSKVWHPDKLVAAAFNEDNIVGPMWTETPDPRTDRVIRRAVGGQNGHFELDEHGCSKLDALAEKWAGLPALAGLTALGAMRERLQRWCAAILLDRIDESCVPFVLAALMKDLDIHEVWIQLSGIDVEHRFQLGKVDLCGINVGVIEAWLAEALVSGFDESALDGYKAALTRRWQGQTAVVYRAYGDTAVVQRDAAEEAQRVCALLRAVNPRGSSPTSRSFLQPIELYSQANIRRLLTDPTKTTCSIQEQLWDGLNALPDEITVTRQSLPELWAKAGWAHIHSLLSSNSISDFQRDVVRSLLIYSRQRLTVDPVEKTLFTISALETLLFAGQRGLNQDTTKRRMSALLAGKPAMNEHVWTCVRAAYGFRNTFLHHGHSIADIRHVEAFLLVAWCFFMRVLAQHHHWPNSKTFCGALDEQYRQRFGDGPVAEMDR